MSVPQAEHEPLAQLPDVAYPSILLAEEPFPIMGFPAPLRDTEIIETMSPKLNSRCSGVCPPVTLRPQGKTPYSTALPASPSLHTLTPHRASATNPSALCSPSQPLFCCMLTLIQRLKWQDPSNPGLFTDMPACFCYTPCYWRCFIRPKYSWELNT